MSKIVRDTWSGTVRDKALLLKVSLVSVGLGCLALSCGGGDPGMNATDVGDGVKTGGIPLISNGSTGPRHPQTPDVLSWIPKEAAFVARANFGGTNSNGSLLLRNLSELLDEVKRDAIKESREIIEQSYARRADITEMQY